MPLYCEVNVQGKVQGVYFRQSAKNMALSLGLKGDVRNCSNGSVFIRVCGNKSDVDTFISWCKEGPPSSIVERVDVKVQNSIPDFSSFEVSY